MTTSSWRCCCCCWSIIISKIEQRQSRYTNIYHRTQRQMVMSALNYKLCFQGNPGHSSANDFPKIQSQTWGHHRYSNVPNKPHRLLQVSHATRLLQGLSRSKGRRNRGVLGDHLRTLHRDGEIRTLRHLASIWQDVAGSMVVGVAIEAWKNPVEAHLTHNPAACCRSVCLSVCLCVLSPRVLRLG